MDRPFDRKERVTRRQMLVGLGTVVGVAAGCGVESPHGATGRITRRVTQGGDGGVDDGGTDGGAPTSALPGVNILDFGAVGDGVADDGPAFAAAIASMVDNNGDGGFLWVPPGKYRIVTQVQANLSTG